MNTEYNKYYIPEIEEFHVGFEVQYNVEGIWVKIPYMINYLEGDGYPTILDTHVSIEKKVIRVKYLDREDIESLGWKLSTTSPVYPDLHMVYEINTNNPKTRYVLIQTINKPWEVSIIIETPNFDGKYETLDCMNIKLELKNKSELEKFMKQAKIRD